jgi:hypothetical protein
MIPEYYDNDGVAVFTTRQLDNFGLPEENNFKDFYWVVESKEYEATFTQQNQTEFDYKHEHEIHRYSRSERFRLCLFQLLGRVGVIGKNLALINDIMYYEFTNIEKTYLPQCLQWEFFRKILKKHRLNAFYNRIPAIAYNLGFDIQLPKVTNRLIMAICADFEAMNEIFPRIRHKLDRKYFPSIRGVCLMLLERYGVPNILNIPVARTVQKVVELKLVFEEIWGYINEELTNLIFS